ncbi:MAG: peroxiredoxin [Polyangiales bacterium]
MLKVGDPAPEIDLPASDGSRFRLSERRGKYTVLYFFPKAFTPGCTAETGCFRDSRGEIVALGAEVVGISNDLPETQAKFAESLHVDFPMVGDSTGKVIRAYGVAWPLLGIARRATFVVGPTQTIEAVFWSELNATKHIDDVTTFLKSKRA